MVSLGLAQVATLPEFFVSPPAEHLSQSSLQSELDGITTVLENYTGPVSLAPLVSSFGGLIQYHNSLLKVESHFDLQSRIMQQDLLMLKIIIWGQLSLWKANAFRFLCDHSQNDNPGLTSPDLFWFTRLSLDIHGWVCVMLQDRVFAPEDYLPQGVAIADTEPGYLQCLPLRIPANLLQFSVTKAEEWVLRWIGLKGGGKEYVSAFFVYSMVQWLGTAALTISQVWKTAQNIPKRLLGKSCWNVVSHEEVSAAVIELKKVVESDKDREWFSIFNSLAKRIIKSKVVFISPEQLFTSQPPQPTIPAPSTHLPSTSDNLKPVGGIDCLVDQVFLCLALVGDDVSHPVSIPKLLPPSATGKVAKIHKFLTEVAHNSDRCLPFRECGRSRFHVLSSPRNPYSPKYLYTIAGLFSAIMVRTILHGTGFLQDHEPFFEDHDHWIWLLELAQEVHKDPKYFCDPAAYGRHCGYSQNINQASVYWETVNKDIYNAWLLDPASYNGHGGNILLSVAKLLSSKGFPGIGRLTAFQIAVDYIKARAITATQEEFVETLVFVNAGAIKGLGRLGYLRMGDNRQQMNLEDVGRAFTSALGN
ncbi:hypothetical protein F5050DRAFT_1810525 [Lentinula boryana]|uniref:Uncharacterized protein n=1 Tax=Lentinula boryana TaxID=40481 RepID=A0ABQ8Q570_9AGAR|nr:hypothetical protein F5050DRAFT_1810525 [Lentinula boryana]